MSSSRFSAVDSTLGYLYQTLCALLYSLRYAKNDNNFQVAIETLDDITFYRDSNDPFELIQTKHHRASSASLSNSSVDLWKSLRIWLEHHESGLIPSGCLFYLLTTSSVSPDSAAYYLGLNERKIDRAVELLNTIAASSSNEVNAMGYALYLSLSHEKRYHLLSKIFILDSAPIIDDLLEELRREIRWAAPKNLNDVFLENLLGWWLSRVVRQLQGVHDFITSDEIELIMDDLRERLQRDCLPVDDDLLDLSINEALINSFSGSIFVQQVKLVTSATIRIQSAIRDYYRAYEQRSRWLRDNLMLDLELSRYERRLVEEWELIHASLCEELGPDATGDIMRRIGASVLQWAEQSNILLRKNLLEPFISRGSLHMLADQIKVGWHPQFRLHIQLDSTKKEDAA